MNKRVQRVENAACLGGISHPCNAKVSLYERLANDYLIVTVYRHIIIICVFENECVILCVANSAYTERTPNTDNLKTEEKVETKDNG